MERERRRDRGEEGERERGREGNRCHSHVLRCQACKEWGQRGTACGQVQLGREQGKQALSPHRHGDKRYTQKTHTHRHTQTDKHAFTCTRTHTVRGLTSVPFSLGCKESDTRRLQPHRAWRLPPHPQSVVLVYLHTLTRSLSSQKRQL